MSIGFLKLYRDLAEKSKPFQNNLSNVEDTLNLYEKERLEVFHKLGYEVNHKDVILTKPNKHHGAAARRKVKTNETSVNEIEVERNKRKEYHKIINETDRFNKMTLELKELVENKKEIPNEFFNKLLQSPTSKKANKENSDSLKLPRISQVHKPTYRRENTILSTVNPSTKWTKEERAKINQLYLELPRTKGKQLGQWEHYYINFANRFRSIFTHRKQDEIIDKVQELIVSRKLKEVGEEQYWDNIKGKNMPIKDRPNFSKSERF